MNTRPDLRLLFRSGREGLAAQEVFADRIDEWTATLSSLELHRSLVAASDFAVDDFVAPRRNVLVFYGVGGIGKTELSRQLELCLSGECDRLPTAWSAVPEHVGRLLPVRVDLSRQTGADFEAVMLAIRLAVGRLGQPMPAFDLALRRYWEVNHPNETLEAYLSRHGVLRRAGSAASLSEHMRAVLDDVVQDLALPTVAGVIATTVVRGVVDALRKKRSEVRTLSRCVRLADLLEADQNIDTLSYFAHLLAWDLSQLSPKRSGTPIILLDTFEEIGDRVHRDLERLIQRVVWLMPNVLFIITGRNRLQWDDAALDGQLDHAGALQWPGLAPGCTDEPCQHLVGYLSEQDREHYLQQRLTADGQPMIPAAVRHRISTRSHGLPLYLDLSVMQFLDIVKRNGAIPGPEEFERDFPALVARIVRDLPVPERTVLRTVSLLDAFSIDLATEASGLGRDAAAMNLVERPFITHDPDAPWPYRLHDLVHSAIRDADSTTDDRWSSRDWRRAARRAFAALGEHLPARDDPHARQRLISCLTQGFRLAYEYDLELDWLIDAAWTYVKDGIWESIELDFLDDTAPPAKPVVALGRAIVAIARRQRVHRQETVLELTTIIDCGLLPTGISDLVRYYLAESQRHLGHYQASIEHLRQVVRGGGPRAADAVRGIAHIARHLGDFPTALAALESLNRDTKYHRAVGHLWWPHGEVTRACDSYGTARVSALAENDYAGAALAQTGLAMAAAFEDRSRADTQIDLARELLRHVVLDWAETQAEIACLLRDAGAVADLPERAAQLELRARAAGLGSSIAYIRLAACFHHAIRREQPELRTARGRLQQHTANGEYTYLVEISHFFDASEPSPGLSRAQWISGSRPADRWADLTAQRRIALGFERRS